MGSLSFERVSVDCERDESRRGAGWQRVAAPWAADEYREPARERASRVRRRLAPIAEQHELVVSHGNGPQIGFLALEEAEYEAAPDSPLDVLGAETQGMIGYLIEQDSGTASRSEKPLATLLTMIEVDPHDAAFDDPSKPIGPSYTSEESEKLATEWSGCSSATATPCVASCRHRRRSGSSRTGRSAGCSAREAVVICAGGGGIPTASSPSRAARWCGSGHRQGPRRALCWRAMSRRTCSIMATDASFVFVRLRRAGSARGSPAYPDALSASSTSLQPDRCCRRCWRRATSPAPPASPR